MIYLKLLRRILLRQNSCNFIQYLPNTLPTPHPSSQFITLEAIPPNTPIFEISAIIHHAPNPSTTPIIPSHHFDALSTHPLLRLALSPYTSNCILNPINIPEPLPHLKLFLCSTELIAPYDSLRIRPPPEPPPCPTAAPYPASTPAKPVPNYLLLPEDTSHSSALPSVTFTPIPPPSVIEYRLSSKIIRLSSLIAL